MQPKRFECLSIVSPLVLVRIFNYGLNAELLPGLAAVVCLRASSNGALTEMKLAKENIIY